MRKSKKATVKKSKSLSINFGVLGTESSRKSFKAGSLLADVIHKFGLQGLTTTVNGTRQQPSYTLRDGDTVLAVPEVKGGC
ncbi:hypothetical protein KKF61_07230 [Patescibacteria group bacterium]|nr:hypothetical protein [Patescibacteria group bacterium]